MNIPTAFQILLFSSMVTTITDQQEENLTFSIENLSDYKTNSFESLEMDGACTPKETKTYSFDNLDLKAHLFTQNSSCDEMPGAC